MTDHNVTRCSKTAEHKRGNGQKAGRHKGGQAMVEFVFVLPLLLLFALATLEVGAAMYDYLRLVRANREAVRLASRGRFTDETVVARAVAAGGLRETEPGVTEPNLRTSGDAPNMGVIITHVDIPVISGDAIQISAFVSGTLTVHDAEGNPVIRPVNENDGELSSMSADELFAYLDYRRGVSREISEYRTAKDYEVMEIDAFVTVETFYTHKLIVDGISYVLPFIEDPITLRVASTMRVLQDSRLD
jgi:hypothetical protein